MIFNSIRTYIKRLQGDEILHVSRYCDDVVQCEQLAHDDGMLKDQLGCKKIGTVTPDQVAKTCVPEQRKVVIFNGNLNHSDNVQALLEKVKPGLNRHCRIIAVAYNPYLSWLYRFVNLLGIRKAPIPRTFIRMTELRAIAQLAGFEIVRLRHVGYVPRLLGFGHILNKLMPLIPGLKWLSISIVIVLRPVIQEKSLPSLSIIIPARNEEGNIENALKRIPRIKDIDMEVIFIEGHSTDNTWQEIQRICPRYEDKFKLKAFQQCGNGKNDAVRHGIENATGKLLAILDADLTMPPELLDKFYEAYVNGHADFINGNRLVYEMENEAMRSLNLLGNIFFAKTLSWMLDHRFGDVLCGTKMLHRVDYEWIKKWREDFGDFDPFGDFELLFPVAVLGIGSIDMPIQYRAREYGDTNISRCYHGLRLLKMTAIGFFKIKLGFN